MHGHTGIGAGISLEGKRVAIFVSFLDHRHLYLECRTFVFLHPERLPASSCIDGECTSQSRLGQDKVGSSLSETVGDHLTLVYLFVVGIAQDDGEFLSLQRFRLQTALDGEFDDTDMHGLSGSVDASVGEQLNRCQVPHTVE